MSERTKDRNFGQNVHETLFSLNVGFAIIFALLIFNSGVAKALRRSAFYFLQPATRILFGWGSKINLLLHLQRWNNTGRDIASTVLILLVAVIVLLALRLVSRTALAEVVLTLTGGLAAIALVPLLYLHVLQATWGPYGGTLYPFGRSFVFSLFLLEISLVCSFLFLTRHWRHWVKAGAVVLLFHYLLWSGQLLWTFFQIPLWSSKLFYFVFPGSGFAWLYYTRNKLAPSPKIS